MKMAFLVVLFMFGCGSETVVDLVDTDANSDTDTDTDTDADSDTDVDTDSDTDADTDSDADDPECVRASDCEELYPDRESYSCYGGTCFYGPLVDEANLVVTVGTPAGLVFDQIQFSVEFVEDVDDLGAGSWLENYTRANWASEIIFEADVSDHLAAVRFNAAYCNAGSCTSWLCEGYMTSAHLTADVTVEYDGETYEVRTYSMSWGEERGCSAVAYF